MAYGACLLLSMGTGWSVSTLRARVLKFSGGVATKGGAKEETSQP